MFNKTIGGKILAPCILVTSVFAAGQAAAYGGPTVEGLSLNIGNPQAILPLENQSKSGKISDFKIKASTTHIQFAGLSGKLTCGVLQGTRPHPSSPTGDGGRPVLYYGVMSEQIQAALYSVKSPDFTIDAYERKSKRAWQGHKKVFSGNGPYTFKIPVSKLTKAGVETSIDPAAVFERALQKHVEEGGDKLEFLRNNQVIVVPAYLSLRAGCWSSYDHRAYDVKPVSIALSYKGDKTLKYSTTIETADNNAVKLPLYVKDVDIKVTPTVSTGQCPRKLPAKASITFNRAPANTRPYKLRFLEDGKPVTAWQEYGLRKRSTASITHNILVEENKQKGNGNQKKLGKASGSKSQVALNVPQVIKNKSTVAIEVKADGKSSRMAVAQYEAKCLKPLKMKQDMADQKSDKPDLTSRSGIMIGSKTSAWGGKLVLEKSDFTAVTPRGCKARFKYGVVNIGKADAAGFNSRLRINGKSGHLQLVMQVNKGSAKNVSGTLLLPAGTYPLTVSIDDAKTVAEIKENNNVFKVKVTVPAICGGGSPRPR